MGFLALALAIIALVAVQRLDREVRALRKALQDLARQAAEPRRAPPRPADPSSAVPPTPLSSSTPVPAVDTAAADSSVTVAPSPAPRPPLPPPPIASPAPAQASQPGTTAGDPEPLSLESRIGERLFLYVGMVVVLLGVAFFLRYAFEHDWMSPLVRVWLGAVSGLAFIAGGRALASRGYRQYGLFVSGGGLAILFLSTYAAFAFYGLLAQSPAFVLLAAIAAATAYLADREASLPLALIGVCGGFVTPFLVSSGGDAHVVLFSYDAVLVAATMFLARRRGWPWLHVVSLTLVIITVALWADRHYADDLYLRIEFFLSVFCALFVVAMVQNRGASDADGRTVANILLVAPALYHAASVVILSDHHGVFYAYLLIVSLATAAGSTAVDAPPLRFAGWVAVLLPLLPFLVDLSDGSTTAAAVSIGIWMMFAAVTAYTARRAAPLSGWDVALVHASGNGAYAGAYFALFPLQPPAVLAAVAVSLAAVNAGVWLWLRTTPSALHWFGVACALVAVAVAVGLEGAWGVVMWAAEAGVMVWLGSRVANRWLRIAGLALFAIAVVSWFNEPSPRAGEPFTPVLNARALSVLFVVAAMYIPAYFTRRKALDDGPHRIERAVLLVGASAVTVLAMSTEIASYWSLARGATPDAALARELMMSAAWAAYAGLLVALGMRYHSPPVRYFAIALFGLTLIKVFVVDVQQLEGIYRVMGFLVVGAILLLASFLYQRSRRTDGASHRSG